MILAAVLAKLGTYGIIRFDLNLFPQATADARAAAPHPGRDRHPLRRAGGVAPSAT